MVSFLVIYGGYCGDCCIGIRVWYGDDGGDDGGVVVIKIV